MVFEKFLRPPEETKFSVKFAPLGESAQREELKNVVESDVHSAFCHAVTPAFAEMPKLERRKIERRKVLKGFIALKDFSFIQIFYLPFLKMIGLFTWLRFHSVFRSPHLIQYPL